MYERWRKLLKVIVKTIPRISSLALTGTFLSPGLRKHLPYLRELPNPKTLALPSADKLHVGFMPPFVCGNMYRGEKGQSRRLQLKQQKLETIHNVAYIVFGSCLRLETQRIGHIEKATVTRNEDGSVLDTFVVSGWRDSLSSWAP